MLKTLSVAVLWFTSLFTLILSLGFDINRAFQAGLIGLIIGMVIVAMFILPSEYTREVFFGSEEELLPPAGFAYFVLGCLTDGIPILLLGLALLIFVIRQLSIQ